MSKVGGKDYDLKKAWDDACDAFAKTTNEDLKTKTKFTPEEVLEQIRAKQEKDEERAAKYRVAKDVLSKTLDCIDNLGNIAAQGASMVFGPAGFAGNALSYLIATGAKYKYIFNSLAELFSKISDFLARFQIYFRMPDVDISLRVIINELLICFVSICGLSIKILKGNKALLYLKVFAFSDDAGVNAKLAELAGLVEKEREMRGTLGYEVEKNIERSVAAGRQETKEGMRELNSAFKEMSELEKKREASTLLAKQLEFIEKALDKPSDSYRTIYQSYIDRRVEGTGEWLQNGDAYNEWATPKPSTVSILALSGGEGYGKSFLTSIAIQDLRKRFPQGESNTNRASVAYYYFQRESKGSKSENALSLGNALKSLALQIAKNDTVYRKDLHAACEKADDPELVELWSKLFGIAHRADATFFLVLDGIDQMEEKHSKALTQILQRAVQGPEDSKDRGALCLRILIAGRTKVVEDVSQDANPVILDLASNNKDDIEKFIRDGISEIKILGGATVADQARRDEIFDALNKNAKGDFISVDLLLKQIAEKRRTAEMLEVLEQFQGEDRSDTIARAIEGLNKTLERQDILDLNELIAWVIAAYRTLTLSQLDTVLRMKNGEDGYSLQPLAESIEERYSKILFVEGVVDPETKSLPLDSVVTFISASIEDYFREYAERNTKEESESVTKNPKGGDVNESEVRIIKRFLESVCDPELYEKFKFESFFQNKLTSTTAVIGFNQEAASLRILTVCVDALCSEDPLWEPLMEYVIAYLPNHISVIDLSLTTPAEKTYIGGKLLQIFSDPKIIAKIWKDDEMMMRRFDWIHSTYYTDSVLNWFKDSAVVKGLGEEGKQWAKDLTSNSRPDADLMEHVAKFVAEKWLRDAYWDLRGIVLFLHSYVCKIEERLDSKRDNSWQVIYEMDQIPVEDIELMINFAKTKLAIENFDYEEYRNLARTYRECEKPQKAIEMFKGAVSMKEDNWLSRWGLSIAYGKDKNYEMAIQTLQEVIDSIKNGTAKEDNPKSDLAEMQRELAQFTKDSGDVEKAGDLYFASVKDFPDDYDAVNDYIIHLDEAKTYSRLVEFMQYLKDNTDKEEGIDRWTRTIQQFFPFSTFHDTIDNAAHQCGNLDIVKQAYEDATSLAKKKLEKDGPFFKYERPDVEDPVSIINMLLFFHGSFLFKTHYVEGHNKAAVELWEQVLLVETTPRTQKTYLAYTKRFVRRDISWAYSRLAREVGSDSELAEVYVERIRAQFESTEEEFNYGDLDERKALARYYSVVGQREKAREVLQVEVKTNLELLSDDDPWNDWQGYAGLASSLMYTGDTEHALAAWSLIVPDEPFIPEPTNEERVGSVDGDAEKVENNNEGGKTEEVKTDQNPEESKKTVSKDKEPTKEPSEGTSQEVLTNGTDKEESEAKESNGEPTPKEGEEPEPEPELRGQVAYFCDGRCGTEWTYANDFHTCKDCIETQFCSDCLNLLREGKLTKRLICGKNHEMLHVPKYDKEKLDKIGKDNVEVDGKVFTVKEWLNEIRKLYGLEIPKEEEGDEEKKTE